MALLLHATGHGQTTDKVVIWFPFGGATLSEEAKAAMDDALSSYDNGKRIIGIRLSGYCDTIGSNACNDRLSLSRVRAIHSYLRLKLHTETLKTPAETLFQSVKGYGKRRPLNDNADSAKRALNRRVEIFLSVVLTDFPPGSAADSPSLLTAVKSPDPLVRIPARDTASTTPIPLSDALLDTGSLAGRNIVLRNVNFYGDRHMPLPSAYFEGKQCAGARA